MVKGDVWDRAVAEDEQRLRGLAAEGKVASRGKGKALKLQERALEAFGHTVGIASEEFLNYRVVPDAEAETVERERQDLKRLQRVLDWEMPDGPDGDELTGMPERMREGLKATTANRLISAWLKLRCVEALVREIGVSFNGIDPLRPVFRDKLDAAREKLLAIQEHLSLLNIDVELREPLNEEIQEMRSWLEDLPTSS